MLHKGVDQILDISQTTRVKSRLKGESQEKSLGRRELKVGSGRFGSSKNQLMNVLVVPSVTSVVFSVKISIKLHVFVNLK